MEFETKSSRLFGTTAVILISYQIVLKFLPWLYFNIIGPKLLGPKVQVRQMGQWAVVTGATDGIGKAYAKALAKKCMNIVLISRSLPKLKDVAKEIGDDFNVETRIIDVDFTEGEEIYDKIRNRLNDLEIGVLVNNVGISYDYPEYFVDVTSANPKFMRDIVAANIHSVTHMSAMILPQMLARNKGVIINISSTAGVIPNPLLSLYSATKAFIDKFSGDLQTEYRDKGIVVQSIQPGFVATNMAKIRKPTTFAPSADIYVASALRTLGFCERTPGYWPHNLMQLFISLTTAITCEQFTSQIILKTLLGMRNRALRNKNKKQ